MQVMLGIMTVLFVSSLILLAIFYFNLKEFYTERVRTIQSNNMETLVNDMEDLVDECYVVSDQILGLVVFQEELEDYAEKPAIEQLQISRNINALLTNIKISNHLVDNIYLLDFYGDGFSTNANWNRAVFAETLPIPLQIDQLGGKIIMPPHPAKYGYSSISSTPVMISFLTYLNRFTESKAIGLVQVDINYDKIAETVENVAVAEGDFFFLIDENGCLLYAPEKETAGRRAEDVTYRGFCLGDVLSGEQFAEGNSYTVRQKDIPGTSWRLVQMNSDEMLNQELYKAAWTWMAGIVAYLLCAALIAASIARGLTKPITNIIGSMKDVGHGNFGISICRPDSRELVDLVDSFQGMVREVDQLMKENIQKEHDKTAMQMRALNAQINSHFLYNTLNTIKWQAIRSGQTEIAKSVVALSEILEYSCKNTDKTVPLGAEFQFVSDYALLQNMRYDQNVQLEFETEEAASQCYVLKMLLQPLVENAFRHAFSRDADNSRIWIKCRVQSGRLEITVRDNGKGFIFRGMDQMNGIGLNNILQRMRLNYGEICSLNIESKNGEGTKVTVQIPVVYGEGEEVENADCR